MPWFTVLCASCHSISIAVTPTHGLYLGTLSDDSCLRPHVLLDTAPWLPPGASLCAVLWCAAAEAWLQTPHTQEKTHQHLAVSQSEVYKHPPVRKQL